jgi:hypothetical protein
LLVFGCCLSDGDGTTTLAARGHGFEVELGSHLLKQSGSLASLWASACVLDILVVRQKQTNRGESGFEEGFFAVEYCNTWKNATRSEQR